MECPPHWFRVQCGQNLNCWCNHHIRTQGTKLHRYDAGILACTRHKYTSPVKGTVSKPRQLICQGCHWSNHGYRRRPKPRPRYFMCNFSQGRPQYSLTAQCTPPHECNGRISRLATTHEPIRNLFKVCYAHQDTKGARERCQIGPVDWVILAVWVFVSRNHRKAVGQPTMGNRNTGKRWSSNR